jgi:sensor histidine kinase YesM
MRRERIYWLCQFAGWSLYTLASTLIYASFNAFSWRQLALQTLICGIGFSLTHAFRLFIQRRGWVRLSPQSLIPRIIAACVMMALLWETLALFLLIFVFRLFTIGQAQLGIVLGTIFSWSATLLIWSLIYFGFHYVERYRKAEIEKWRLEAAVKDAELRALKSQMNPHFIFNCLNSVRALIAEDPERAQTVVTQLVNILRYSLQSGSAETVTLEEELRTVSDYLALETIRLEERLQVRLSIDPNSLAVPVPTMLVQTLVENGVKYGVATRPGGGEISLTSRVEDSTLHIHVTNTGQLGASGDSIGVGWRNASERLKLLFGESASLTLESAPPGHVTARIEIPLRDTMLDD